MSDKFMDDMEIAKEIVRRVKPETLKKIAKMKFKNREATITNSKFGGIPFIPVGGEYPMNPETGESLHFLMQINFAEMPPIPDFPTEGLLQIFIAAGDDFWEEPTLNTIEDADMWQILYWEDISHPMSPDDVAAFMPAPPVFEYYASLFGAYGKEYLIEFEEHKMPIAFNDFRCEEILLKCAKEIAPERSNGWISSYGFADWPRPCFDVFLEELRAAEDIQMAGPEKSFSFEDRMDSPSIDTRIGGYPENIQMDPRGGSAVPEDCELLLQFGDAYDENGEIVMDWGGIATLFIKPEDLRKRDFSKVYYYYDCD